MSKPMITVAMLKSAPEARVRRSKPPAKTYTVDVRPREESVDAREPNRAHPMFTAPQLGIRRSASPQVAVLDESQPQ